MPHAPSVHIHPTAIVAPEAVLGENVEVGAYAVIEGPVTLGPDCVVRPGAYLYGPMTMGRGNQVYTGAVLGEKPQHLKYRNEPTTLEIGDNNIFREHVTIHRGTTHSMKTVVGSDNFFMAHSHVAHDCIVGNRCVLANCALVAGHCELGDNVFLSGHTAVHQFVKIGRLALLSGVTATGKDVPPFIIQQGIDCVAGINVVGMRRAGLSNQQINEVKDAFRILFREKLAVPVAIAKMEHELGASAPVQEMIAFLRGSTRGINGMRSRFMELAA